MKKKTRIAQITDLHISPDNNPRFGVNTRNSFESVLNTIKSEKIDFLAITGDLAWMRGEKKAYLWLKELLEEVSIPYRITSGNHDKSMKMAKILHHEHYINNGNLDYILTMNGQRFIFLDCGNGKLKKKQLQWLRETADYLTNDTLLFMHYPPAPGGSVYMDKNYPLKNSDEFKETIKELKSIKYIFCGHYHFENVYTMGDKKVYVTPSTCIQIDCNNEKLVFTKEKPAYRLIDWDGKVLNTSVKYV